MRNLTVKTLYHSLLMMPWICCDCSTDYMTVYEYFVDKNDYTRTMWLIRGVKATRGQCGARWMTWPVAICVVMQPIAVLTE